MGRPDHLVVIFVLLGGTVALVAQSPGERAGRLFRDSPAPLAAILALGEERDAEFAYWLGRSYEESRLLEKAEEQYLLSSARMPGNPVPLEAAGLLRLRLMNDAPTAALRFAAAARLASGDQKVALEARLEECRDLERRAQGLASRRTLALAAAAALAALGAFSAFWFLRRDA